MVGIIAFKNVGNGKTGFQKTGCRRTVSVATSSIGRSIRPVTSKREDRHVGKTGNPASSRKRNFLIAPALSPATKMNHRFPASQKSHLFPAASIFTAHSSKKAPGFPCFTIETGR